MTKQLHALSNGDKTKLSSMFPMYFHNHPGCNSWNFHYALHIITKQRERERNRNNPDKYAEDKGNTDMNENGGGRNFKSIVFHSSNESKDKKI